MIIMSQAEFRAKIIPGSGVTVLTVSMFWQQFVVRNNNSSPQLTMFSNCEILQDVHSKHVLHISRECISSRLEKIFPYKTDILGLILLSMSPHHYILTFHD